MKIDRDKAFLLMIKYLEKECVYLGKNSAINTFICGSNLSRWPYSTSLTVDPFYWHDWIDMIEEYIEKDPSVINDTDGLSFKVAFEAIHHFVHNKYWKMGKGILFEDAYKNLVSEYDFQKKHFTNSKLWHEWQEAIAIADGTYEEKYGKSSRTTPKSKNIFVRIKDLFIQKFFKK